MRRLVSLACACAVVAMLAAPAGAQAFSKAIWGTPYVNGVNQFPMYRTLGVKIIEASLNWEYIAPTRPKDPANPRDHAYIWPTSIQQTVTQAKRFHMQVMLQIVGAPAWANGGHPWNWAPRPSAYATFAAAAAHRYPSVHQWMIWGEPDRAPNWQPLTPSKPGSTSLDAAQKVAPHNYARMLDAAYGALKQVSKRNIVIGGSTYTTGDIGVQLWIENLRLPDGKPPRMDEYAHNPFTLEAPKFSPTASPLGAVEFADLPRLAGWVDKYLHPGLPLFLSEFTIPTAADQEFGYFVSPATQARWITDALRLSRRYKRIAALGWIHVYDDPPESYGGLLTVNGVRKPGFYAFAHG